MTTQNDAVKLIIEKPDIISNNLTSAGVVDSSDKLLTVMKLNDKFSRAVYVLVHYSSLTDELAGKIIRKAGSLLRKDKNTARVLVVLKTIPAEYKEALTDSKLEWIELAEEKIVNQRKREGKTAKDLPVETYESGGNHTKEDSIRQEAVNDTVRAFCEWLLSKDLNASWREFTLLVSDQIEAGDSTENALPGKQRHFQLYRNQFLAYEGKLMTEYKKHENTDGYSSFLTVHLANQTKPGEDFNVNEETEGVSVELNKYVNENTGELDIEDKGWQTCLPEQDVKKIAMIMNRWKLGVNITFRPDPGNEGTSLQLMIKQMISLSLLIQAAKGKVSYVMK
ncbi:hypothetical protein MM300_17880 [Evansella sp. LMS18]|uniref:hypothetical protein n=1 Tax=Evansella sp. LMS18 TaxID=2924033 RepID=UPI0020D09B46|nr:hypothetical protein [Evansella sp. LMS18]UTR09739.1 hypothetical protein MM300_17880 [Evansella sp. LMS18]